MIGALVDNNHSFTVTVPSAGTSKAEVPGSRSLKTKFPSRVVLGSVLRQYKHPWRTNSRSRSEAQASIARRPAERFRDHLQAPTGLPSRHSRNLYDRMAKSSKGMFLPPPSMTPESDPAGLTLILSRQVTYGDGSPGLHGHDGFLLYLHTAAGTPAHEHAQV